MRRLENGLPGNRKSAGGVSAFGVPVAYAEVRSHGETRWGVAMDPNITTASLKAVLSALERLGVDVAAPAASPAAAK